MKKVISMLIVLIMVSAVCVGAGVNAAALAGDVNGDGEVNNKDVVTLFRYVSGGIKLDDESAYDFNNDGEVNNKDVVALFRALSSVDEPAETEEPAEDTAEEETETDEVPGEETSAEEPEETEEPGETEPDATEPEETEPDITGPDETEPEATEPEETEPDVTEPDETEPDETEPEATEPEETEPDETEPEVTEPEETEPDETEPEATEPEETEPDETEPEATEPEETEPDETEPEVTEPEETEPDETEPDETEPEVTEPEVTEPEETEPETTEEEEDLGEFTVVTDVDAKLAVSGVFGSHMVIQRDQPITIFGTSNRDGALVRGTFMGEETLGKVKNGKWEIKFPSKEATADPQTLVVEDSCGNKIEYSDILIGDVWIISGQSNAVRTISQIGASGLKVDTSLPLRVFQQDENDVWNNKEAATSPCDDPINPKRIWKAPKRASALLFSAIGWYVGSRLAEETGIPQGMICTAAGAASIAELMPKELADKFGYTKGIYVNPGDIYNALMHPFTKIKIKAMIFFQGESEGGANSNPTSANYARDFEALMTELRSRWGIDFPIYNIQLSNYVGEECETFWTHVGEVRTKQYEAYKTMSGVRLIPSYDLGSKTTDPDGAHSPYKKELSDRLSSLALADLYGIGQEEAALAPEFDSMTVVSTTDTEKVIDIKFKHVGEGLTSLSGTDTASGFVYGTNARPYAAAKRQYISGQIISKDTVRVTVPIKTKYIGYACMAQVAENDVLITQLYDSKNLPPLSFFEGIQ